MMRYARAVALASLGRPVDREPGKLVRRTMVSSQGLAWGPRNPAKSLNAFISDSWTTSSASAALPVSQRARLQASSKWVITVCVKSVWSTADLSCHSS